MERAKSLESIKPRASIMGVNLEENWCIIHNFMRDNFDVIKEALVGYDTYVHSPGSLGEGHEPYGVEKLTYAKFIKDYNKCQAYLYMAISYLRVKQFGNPLI